jgi:hypothetical protein
VTKAARIEDGLRRLGVEPVRGAERPAARRLAARRPGDPAPVSAGDDAVLAAARVGAGRDEARLEPLRANRELAGAGLSLAGLAIWIDQLFALAGLAGEELAFAIADVGENGVRWRGRLAAR